MDTISNYVLLGYISRANRVHAGGRACVRAYYWRERGRTHMCSARIVRVSRGRRAEREDDVRICACSADAGGNVLSIGKHD